MITSSPEYSAIKGAIDGLALGNRPVVRGARPMRLAMGAAFKCQRPNSAGQRILAERREDHPHSDRKVGECEPVGCEEAAASECAATPRRTGLFIVEEVPSPTVKIRISVAGARLTQTPDMPSRQTPW